ncbi:MAG: hypothetical protein H8D38_04330 [DPANN group archaeon]|nr:hypothetical protein [DPANN group archaeon]
MKKQHHLENPNQVVIMVIVAVVAMLAIFSANQANIGGEAVTEPGIECEEEFYCINWTWVNETEPVCLNSEFVEYKKCDKYSWPEDADGKPTMTCDSWGIYYENECTDWSAEVSWHRECTKQIPKKKCYAVIE